MQGWRIGVRSAPLERSGAPARALLGSPVRGAECAGRRVMRFGWRGSFWRSRRLAGWRGLRSDALPAIGAMIGDDEELNV
jgi:hypothetical protein